jgi:hypothetical protein
MRLVAVLLGSTGYLQVAPSRTCIDDWSLPAACTSTLLRKEMILYEQLLKIVRLKIQASDLVKPHMRHQASHELQAWHLAFRAISMLRLKQG